MKRRWMTYAAALFSIVLILAACGGKKESSGSSANDQNDDNEKEGEKYTIGVTQIVEHPSLDSALKGFEKAIKDAGLDVEYDKQNAQNDNSSNSTIANNLAGAGVDLIFANSTPSAQAAASATQDIPIVFTSVTDAVAAELVASNEEPGGNVTGTIDNHPDAISNTMKFLKEQIGAKKVGMIFNSGEQNSRLQVDQVKEILKDMDMEVVEASVATSADVKQAAESLVGSVDSLYIITDNTVVSALESVVSVANDNKIPMMVGEFDSVERGGLGAYGFEYYDIGYEAGEMAAKILKGEATPDSLPVQVPQNLKLVVNKKTVETIGLEIQDDWNAETVE
ncbi:ABC transporter substrate-binding protein [Mammaliicoccus sciuri]|uniref:ABC superfamily ATP binding cassette transporter, binding protein n=2 Tax=Sporosarcina newyorkensis TaxID=759851 RepID=F9DNZ8_9BACL|nr:MULTISPECIES: ABC transporter substrate-binding protein [Sporosarcina]EGQ27407.1 ABC superfamily ATP binding cassette transporter, binding protein [Sporosarcina newyorkensis 2681]MBY0221932.1 ABC transporter substrate-binding protein [Sporosarcina aquimarina]SKA99703.1 putative ABC transport system substrate-binding protein [Sporosarcina newyorkensis]